MDHRIRFGHHTLDLAREQLLRGGRVVPLRPKTFALLRYLASHPGRVVTKDELLAQVWAGVVVTEDSLTHGISELREALGDTQRSLLQTVPRRGYRFDPPRPQDAAEPAVPAPAATTRRRAFAAMFAAMALAAVALLLLHGDTTRPRAGLSVVVLPYTVDAAEAQTVAFAAVLTESLTASLARLQGVRVVGSGSARSLAGASAAAAARQFGVEHAVQGSLARVPGGMQVRTRLIAAASDRIEWADEAQLAGGDPDRLARAVLLRLTGALGAELLRTELTRGGEQPADADAEALAIRCEALSLTGGGEGSQPAPIWCERALQIDPDNVRALSRLGAYFAARVSRVQSPDPQVDLARAHQLVERALQRDPSAYVAHCARAEVLAGEHRLADAQAAAERCLELHPSHTEALRILAIVAFFRARPDDLLRYTGQALQLSPRDPALSTFQLFHGWGLLMQGQDDRALEWFRRASAASPGSPTIAAALAATLALTGRDAEARAAMTRYLALPRTRAVTIAQWRRADGEGPAFEAFDRRFKEGLRRAGMPEA